jgi:hypothetical protein
MLSDVTGRCLEDGGILHRDVSDNDITIAESPAEGARKGTLINLDLVKELDSQPSGACHGSRFLKAWPNISARP